MVEFLFNLYDSDKSYNAQCDKSTTLINTEHFDKPSTARIHRRVASTVQLWSREFVTREGSGSCLINRFVVVAV